LSTSISSICERIEFKTKTSHPGIKTLPLRSEGVSPDTGGPTGGGGGGVPVLPRHDRRLDGPQAVVDEDVGGRAEAGEAGTEGSTGEKESNNLQNWRKLDDNMRNMYI